MYQGSVSTSSTTPAGWTGLDRATWVEVFGFVDTGTAGAIQGRLSSDNGATWSAYGSLSGVNTSAGTTALFRVLVNIKTGAFRFYGANGASGNTAIYNSGTLAFTTTPNALQLRHSINANALNMDAKVLGGQA